MSRNILRNSNFRRFSLWKKSAPPRTYHLVQPGTVSKSVTRSDIPPHIRVPDYADSGEPQNVSPNQTLPDIWSESEIQGIRQACSLSRQIMNQTKDIVRAGITTDELNGIVHREILSHNAYPSQLNFHGYPKSISTSVNNVAVHGVPDDRQLQDGDILGVDITVFLDGFHGDCSETFAVGSVDTAGRHLISVAQECLYQGISVCGPGRPFRHIGYAISRFARKRQKTVIPYLLGHGIGAYFHGPPDIYHTLNNYPGIMQPGMVFTIEPCVADGTKYIETHSDGWTILTADGARAAQFEHTVLVTEEGVEILTA